MSYAKNTMYMYMDVIGISYFDHCIITLFHSVKEYTVVSVKSFVLSFLYDSISVFLGILCTQGQATDCPSNPRESHRPWNSTLDFSGIIWIAFHGFP
jgi:hypothetical protein